MTYQTQFRDDPAMLRLLADFASRGGTIYRTMPGTAAVVDGPNTKRIGCINRYTAEDIVKERRRIRTRSKY